MRRRRAFGARPDSGRSHARHWPRPQNNFPAPSNRLRLCRLRRRFVEEQIKLQVALIHPLFHIRGLRCTRDQGSRGAGTPVDRESRSTWRASRRPAASIFGPLRFLGRELPRVQRRRYARPCDPVSDTRQAQGTKVPQMMGHHVMGISLAATGDLVHGLTHFDRGVALYDPEQHRPLATRFGADVRVANVSFRSLAQWMLGYPEAALADNEHALRRRARDCPSSHVDVRTLLCVPGLYFVRKIRASNSVCLRSLSLWQNEQGALFWKSFGTSIQGWVFGLTGKATGRSPNASLPGSAALRSTGARATVPSLSSHWQRPMRKLPNSRTPGAALATR